MAKGGGVLMSIMIPTCNAHAYMKFSKKNFAPYAKNATAKNIIPIKRYNVGMKSLDRAIIVSDTDRNVSNFYYLGSGSGYVSGSVSVSGSAFGSGFRLFHTPRDWPQFFFLFFPLEIAEKGTRPISSFHE